MKKEKNIQDNRYNSGSITMTVFYMLILILPLFFGIGMYIYQNQTLLAKKTKENDIINELLVKSNDVMNNFLQFYKHTEISYTQVGDFTVTVEDLSGRINPYFVGVEFLRLYKLIEEGGGQYSYQNIEIARKKLDNFSLIENSIPSNIQKYFTKYSYINVNVDSLEMIEHLLRYRNISDENVTLFINKISENRQDNKYLNTEDLDELLQASNITILDNFLTTKPLLNINIIDIDLLREIMGIAYFNIIDLDETIEFIQSQKLSKNYIENDDLETIIRTKFGSLLIFQILGTESNFFGIKVCKQELCNTRVMSYNGINEFRILSESLHEEKN